MSPTVQNYRFGSITVDKEKYSKDLIILPDRVIPNWWRDDGHQLKPQDLDAVLEDDLDVLVVGTGAYGRMHVTQEAREAIESAGIRLIAEPTGDAVETYNRLSDKQRAGAALHLTC